MYCKHCGTDIPGDSDFCEKCGKKITKDTTPVEESPKKVTTMQAAAQPPKRNMGLIITLSIVLPLIFIGIIIAVIAGGVGACAAFFGSGEVSSSASYEEEAVEEPYEKEPYEEDEEDKTQATQPTISLSIIEGPTKADNMCYYRIKANVTGTKPSIVFNRDDSNGNLGNDISQVNIYSEDETVTLTATASNSAGSATDSVTVKGCSGMIAPDEPKPPDEEEEDWIVRTISGWSVPLIFGGYESIERGDTATMLQGGNGVFICHIHLILDDEENENWWNNCEVSIKIKATDGIISDENSRQFYFTAPDYPCDVKITATQTTKCNGDIIGTDTDTLTVHVLQVFGE